MEALNPGRNLDVLVAKKVMGAMTPDYSFGNAEVKSLYVDQVPRYSTDIAAAWEVAEKFENVSVVRINANDGQWYAELDGKTNDYRRSIAFASTAPHAICLAALKAVGA